METFFLRHAARRVIRYFSGSRRSAKIFTAFLFLLLTALVSAGIFFFFKRGFESIARDLYYRDALILYIAELFFLAVSFLIFAGSLITTIFTLFRRPYDFWIFASPRFRRHVSSTFARVFLSSVWPLIIVALPALIAAERVFGFGFGGFFAGAASLFGLTLVAVLAAYIVVLGCAWILSFIPRRSSIRLSIRTLGASVGILCAAAAFGVWQRISASNLLDLFYVTDLERARASVERISEVFSVFPSHASAQVLSTVSVGDGLHVFAPFLTLALYVLVFCVLGAGLGYSHYRLWVRLQEGTGGRGVRIPVRLFGLRRFLARIFGMVQAAIFEKEFIVMARTGRNILWAGFIFALWLLQTGLNIILARTITHAELDSALISPIAVSLQFMTMVFFISAFVLRFAFPSFSAEGKTFWILGSAPIDFKKIFFGKCVFFSTLFVSLGLATALLNAAILGLPVLGSIVVLFSFAVSIFFLTVFGLSLGALFLNLETDDPEILSTSLPGLFFILISLIYGASVTVSMYAFLAHGAFRELAISDGASLISAFGFLMVTSYYLRRREFVKLF